MAPADSNAGDALALWLALELRRARTAFDKSRKEQDADCEAKGLRRSGVRVILTLKSASEICVALADATIARAAEHSASIASWSQARDRVLLFTKEIVSTAIPLAHFVSGGAPPVIQAAADKGSTLLADVRGAFQLAQAPQQGGAPALAPDAGHTMPPDDAILAKMQELTGGGLSRDEAAKRIRMVPGFEAVGNEHARRAVAGKLHRGRPRKRRLVKRQ